MESAKPLALGIEDLDASSDESRHLVCSAEIGLQPGLGFDACGTVIWQQSESAAAFLCVSADKKLILLRTKGGSPIQLSRSGRSLEVPEGKPVVVIDQDEMTIAHRHFKIHCHGESSETHTPFFYRLATEGKMGILARGAVAAGIALTLSLGGVSCKDKADTQEKIEVRPRPPVIAPPKPPEDAGQTQDVSQTKDTGQTQDAGQTKETK